MAQSSDAIWAYGMEILVSAQALTWHQVFLWQLWHSPAVALTLPEWTTPLEPELTFAMQLPLSGLSWPPGHHLPIH